MVKVNVSGAESFFRGSGPDFELAAKAHQTLADKSGAGADFTGWAELPQRIKDTELDAIVRTAELIRSRSKALIVIGIGGSYLGARGAIELLRRSPARTIPGSSSPATVSALTICATCCSSWAIWTST